MLKGRKLNRPSNNMLKNESPSNEMSKYQNGSILVFST